MNIIYGRIGRSSNMGATVDGDGCGLRVWAPNARKVALVAGEDLRAAAAQYRSLQAAGRYRAGGGRRHAGAPDR
jgi:1,4-alpha-glucan branching enzyme